MIFLFAEDQGSKSGPECVTYFGMKFCKTIISEDHTNKAVNSLVHGIVSTLLVIYAGL